MSDEQQTQQADDPSGPGWRDVSPDELLQPGDMFDNGGRWERTGNPGITAKEGRGGTYRRRIEPQQPQPEPQPQAINPHDPSGEGWAWVAKGDTVREGDMWRSGAYSWCTAERVGETVQYNAQYRRRIEPEQPSDSEPETMEQLRRRLAECEVLLAEADRGGQQVNAELQQLREQVQTLTRELKAERDNGMTALRSQNRLGQEALAEALQTWLRPVLELVAEHPEDCGPLAVSVLGYLPGIASRLIEE